jgi:GNAT superfamily N-acetyltransferase
MQPEIRLATVEDLPSLADLYRQLNPEDEALPPNQFAAVSEDILSSKHFELVVAESGGRLVGTCYLNVIPNLTRGGRPYAVIENVVVTSHLRNRGIGKSLLRYALTRAWERGCYKAMLQTGSKSEAKHRFYRSCGFSQTDKVAFVARPSPPGAS